MKNLFYSLLRVANSLVLLIKNVIWEADFRSVVKIRIFENIALKFLHKGEIAKHLFASSHLVLRGKGFESDSLKLFLDNINPGDVIFDIGANIGLYSLIASEKIGPTGKIYAFEPSLDTFNTLNENVRLNGCNNVALNNLALGESEGTGYISSEKKDAYIYVKYESDNAGDQQEIIMTSIDAYIEKNSIARVNFVKIDIEGAELLCLQGGKEMLKRDLPIILFEAYEPFCERFNYNIYEIIVFLSGLGYKLYQYESFQWIAVKRDHELSS